MNCTCGHTRHSHERQFFYGRGSHNACTECVGPGKCVPNYRQINGRCRNDQHKPCACMDFEGAA